MTTVKSMKRVFVLGAARINDSTPNLSLDDSVRLLSKTYPQFRHTKIYPEDGVIENGEIVYTVKMLPAKSNG